MKFAIARRRLEDKGLWGCGSGALALELKEIPGDAANGLHSVIAIKPIHPAFAKEEDGDQRQDDDRDECVTLEKELDDLIRRQPKDSNPVSIQDRIAEWTSAARGPFEKFGHSN